MRVFVPGRSVRTVLFIGLVLCFGAACGRTSEHVPSERVPSESVFVSVSVGEGLAMLEEKAHACGLWPNGTVECWGSNHVGQANPPGGRFTSISAGSDYTCGVRPSGTIECWGVPRRVGTDGEATPPGDEFSWDEFSSVYAGDGYVCGERYRGDVCWGTTEDLAGKLTNEVPPPSLEFASVSAGQNHTCGVTTEGSIACWGNNSFGDVAPPAGEFSSVSVSRDRSCGLRVDGTALCWGDNPGSGLLLELSRSIDEIGDALSGNSSTTEATIRHPGGVFASISAGPHHTCGVRPSGTVECWGKNSRGQANPPDGEFSSVSAGDYHTCGLKTDSRIACWGSNTTYESYEKPDEDAGQATPPDGEFSSVSAGGDRTCGVRIDGTVVCWGVRFDDQNFIGEDSSSP